MKKIISICLCFIIMLNLSIAVLGEDNFEEEDLVLSTTEKRTDTFDYPLWGDPNYISDEEFFGVWNDVEEKWVSKPYWAYNRYPELAAVETAAKAGNYDEAERELLEYYRSQKYKKIDPVMSIDKTSIVRSELLGKNFYAVSAMNGLSLEIFSVDNDWQEISIDVTASIRSAAGSESYRTFLINSIDKEKSHAEFYSKESGEGPVLSLVINGVPMELTAARDTYISAGTNSLQNYGDEQKMIVQESGIFLNHDADTKRAYIAFDLAQIKETDVINSATFKIKGRNAGGTGEKEMLLYQWNDSAWEEDEVCWDYFSEHLTFSCNDMDAWDYVTSNKTNIKGKICFFHRGDELDVPARVFDYTKDESYAYTFLRQIMGLVNSIGVDPSVMNALDMSTHLSNTSKSMFYTIDSEYMSPEIFTALIKHLWLMTDWQVENYYGTATNNWGSFATLGVYSIIARFNELTKFDYWIKKTKDENDRLNIGFALSDGTCIELAQGYTNTLLNTLYRPVEISVLTDTPLPYSDFVLEQIYKMLHAHAYGISPGFHGFHWGDSQDYRGNYVIPQIKKWYETVFDDVDEFEFFATGGASGKAPDFTSISFPDGLRTIMRSDWTDKALALQITGKSVGSHGHKDVTSISMFAYGRFLLTDQAYGTILTGDIRDYMISSPQHNLVTMNNKDQATRKDGICKAVEINDMYDFATYTTPLTVDAKAHERSVLFARDSKFWIISDYLSPKEEDVINTYQQHWHMLPSANISIDEDTKVVRSNFDDVNVKVTPIGPEDFVAATIEDSIFSPDSGSLANSRKAVYHKSKTGDVIFDVVVVPENAGENFSVESSRIDCGLPQGIANCFYFQLNDNINDTYKKYYYYHLNDDEQKQKVTIGRFSTDATTMLIEEGESGSIQSVFLMDATILEDSTLKNKVIFKSMEPVKSISFKPNGQIYELISSSMDEIEIENMTFYGFSKIQNVMANGIMVNANSKGGYLYLGDLPILDIEDEDPDSQPGNGSDTGGSSNKGGGTAHSSASRGNTVSSGPVEIIPVEQEPQVPDNIKSELEGHWGEDEILNLYKEKIIIGDPNLRLKDEITRAEFVTIIVKALNLELVDPIDEFHDVNLDDWFSRYIATAKVNELIDGSDGRFRPNDIVTREEMCKIIITVYDKFVQSLEEELDDKVSMFNEFNDDKEISEWARDYVYRAVALGLMNGMDNDRFAPKDNTLRDQAFTVIGRLQKFLK